MTSSIIPLHIIPVPVESYILTVVTHVQIFAIKRKKGIHSGCVVISAPNSFEYLQGINYFGDDTVYREMKELQTVSETAKTTSFRPCYYITNDSTADVTLSTIL